MFNKCPYFMKAKIRKAKEHPPNYENRPGQDYVVVINRNGNNSVSILYKMNVIKTFTGIMEARKYCERRKWHVKAETCLPM